MKIHIIQPTSTKQSATEPNQTKKRRVAAYARVSTLDEEQLNSYENQITYYTNYIKSHPDWEFVEVYSDEGISGLNTKRRLGFKRMIRDARNGKIDLIITKSISRFARNTVDSLSITRYLKNMGVEVYFEKENIHTFDPKGEFLLSILSSIAQEESRSISANVTWGMRKNMQNGKVSMAYSNFLGYRKGADGRPEVDPEEARIIRQIYSLYLEGKTLREICRILIRNKVRTPSGKLKWSTHVVSSILRNEKYTGNALLQKSYTSDFINKKLVKNDGTIPQYYVENSHPAIIAQETFDLVQEEYAKRNKKEAKDSGGRHNHSVFDKKLYCGDCGSIFGVRHWQTTTKGVVYVWRCYGRNKANCSCKTPIIRDEDLRGIFIKTLNQLISGGYNKEEVIELPHISKALLASFNKCIEKIKAKPDRKPVFDEEEFLALVDHIKFLSNGKIVTCFKNVQIVTVCI